MLQDEWAEEALRLDEEEDSRASALDDDEEEEDELELDRDAEGEEDEGWEDLGDLLGDEGLDVIEVRIRPTAPTNQLHQSITSHSLLVSFYE